MYSSTSSISNITTTTSSACNSNLATVSDHKEIPAAMFKMCLFQSTNLSPNIISMPGSPPRITMINAGTPMVPLSLISKPNNDDAGSKVSINPIRLTSSLSTKSNLMSIATPTSNSSHNQLQTALNLKAGEVPSSCQTMPLNLHAAAATIQPPMNGLKNGLKGYNR